MRRARITITLDNDYLKQTDALIDEKKIRNRSHAIEYVLSQYFKPRINKAVILAGGKGSKLRPYTYEIPKSLLPIKGKPLLEHLILQLKENHIDDIVLATGYLGDKIKEFCGDGSKFGVTLSYSEESESLQTGGAVLKAKHFLARQPFLVLHGDIVTDFAIRDIVSFHENEKPLTTIALASVSQPEHFGQLKLHGTKVVQFYQNLSGTEIKSHLIHAGIYVFEPKVFEFFPKTKKFLLEDVIQELINKKTANGFVFEGQWFDAGTPRGYEQAIKHFKESPHRNRK